MGSHAFVLIPIYRATTRNGTKIWIYIPWVCFACLRTCKSKRDSLTVKFFDGATHRWQKEIDIFVGHRYDFVRRTDFRGTPLSLANFIFFCYAYMSWTSYNAYIYATNIKDSFSFIIPLISDSVKNRIGPITTFSRTCKTYRNRAVQIVFPVSNFFVNDSAS